MYLERHQPDWQGRVTREVYLQPLTQANTHKISQHDTAIWVCNRRDRHEALILTRGSAQEFRDRWAARVESFNAKKGGSQIKRLQSTTDNALRALRVIFGAACLSGLGALVCAAVRVPIDAEFLLLLFGGLIVSAVVAVGLAGWSESTVPKIEDRLWEEGNPEPETVLMLSHSFVERYGLRKVLDQITEYRRDAMFDLRDTGHANEVASVVMQLHHRHEKQAADRQEAARQARINAVTFEPKH